MTCLVCGGAMREDVLGGTYRCGACGFFAGDFPVAINAGARLDEGLREPALLALRTRNFRTLLAALKPLVSGTVLDVGCAHGWFLAEAKAAGYDAEGIEPDVAMAAHAQAAGHSVAVGFFPRAAAAKEYDIVSFNDVFEHLPDLPAVVKAIGERLGPRGAVVINLPVSDGPIFRLARILARMGLSGPYRRMWQQGLPSPHLSYFSAATLNRFMQAQGYELAQSGRMDSVSTDNLWRRIRYDRSVLAPWALLYFAGALMLTPFLSLFPSDVQYFIFRRANR